MTQKNPDSIPTRSQKAQAETVETTVSKENAPASVAKAAPAGKRDLSGDYRVREGYTIAHGALDESGRHKHSKGGEIVTLTDAEARSIIMLTKDQRNADGTPNGPAIETKAAYDARVEAERAHREFLESLADMNGMPV